MRPRSSLLAAAVLCAVLGFAGAAAAGCRPDAPMAGMILNVQGARSAVTIQRGGAEFTPAVGTILCARDIVLVARPDVTVLIKLFDGSAQTLASGQHSIAALGGSNILERALQEKVDAFAPQIERHSEGIVGRDAKPLPFAFVSQGLGQGEARLSAGWQGVYLHWRGGVAPFDVTVTPPGGSATIQIANLQANEAHVLAGTMQAGRWEVRVKDLVGRELKGGFTVDPALQHPAAPAAGPFAQLDDAMTAISIAGAPGLSFEAEQVFAAAPDQGLSRVSVLDTIACAGGQRQDWPDCGAGPGGAPQ